MTIIKAVGGVLIVASGWILSRGILRRDEIAVKRLLSFEELLKSIQSRIENFCMPTDEILADLPIELFEKCGYDFLSAPRRVEELVLNCPFSEDKELCTFFEKFFLSLGTSYKSEEVTRCKLACDDLGAIIKRRSTENTKRRKTVPALGFCISLIIVIVAF